MSEFVCPVCGDPFHGGLRQYIDHKGSQRVACADEHACCDAYARNYPRTLRTQAERRARRTTN